MGVSMRGSLVPVLADVIMTETENVVVRTLIESDIIKIKVKFVDNALA